MAQPDDRPSPFPPRFTAMHAYDTSRSASPNAPDFLEQTRKMVFLSLSGGQPGSVEDNGYTPLTSAHTQFPNSPRGTVNRQSANFRSLSAMVSAGVADESTPSPTGAVPHAQQASRQTFISIAGSSAAHSRMLSIDSDSDNEAETPKLNGRRQVCSAHCASKQRTRSPSRYMPLPDCTNAASASVTTAPARKHAVPHRSVYAQATLLGVAGAATSSPLRHSRSLSNSSDDSHMSIESCLSRTAAGPDSHIARITVAADAAIAVNHLNLPSLAPQNRSLTPPVWFYEALHRHASPGSDHDASDSDSDILAHTTPTSRWPHHSAGERRRLNPLGDSTQSAALTIPTPLMDPFFFTGSHEAGPRYCSNSTTSPSQMVGRTSTVRDSSSCELFLALSPVSRTSCAERSL